MSGAEPDLVEFNDRDVLGELREATFLGDTASIARYIGNGLDINRPLYPDGTTMLNTAIDKGHVPLVALLLESGAKVNMSKHDPDHDPLITPPLLRCLSPGKGGRSSENAADIVTLLCKYGADVNGILEETVMRRPIHVAASLGNRRVVAVLLAYGADVNAKMWNSRTALHLAGIQNHKGVCMDLIRANIDVRARASTHTDAFASGETNYRGHTDLGGLLNAITWNSRYLTRTAIQTFAVGLLIMRGRVDGQGQARHTESQCPALCLPPDVIRVISCYGYRDIIQPRWRELYPDDEEDMRETKERWARAKTTS